MKRIIHVDQSVIKRNAKTGERVAPITCKTYKDNLRGHRVHFTDGASVIYSPDKPLSCGAKVWIETDNEILVTTDDGLVSL